MRREIYAAAAAVHLTIAALFSTHVRPDRFLPAAIERPLRLYGEYTGAATHFNFFAPEVPTEARVTFLLTDADGRTREERLGTPNAEVNERIAAMVPAYSMPAIRPLLVRSWAVYMLVHNPQSVSVEVRVSILDLPTLREASAGKAAAWVEVERTLVRRDEIR